MTAKKAYAVCIDSRGYRYGLPAEVTGLRVSGIYNVPVIELTYENDSRLWYVPFENLSSYKFTNLEGIQQVLDELKERDDHTS